MQSFSLQFMCHFKASDSLKGISLLLSAKFSVFIGFQTTIVKDSEFFLKPIPMYYAFKNFASDPYLLESTQGFYCISLSTRIVCIGNYQIFSPRFLSFLRCANW